MKIIIAQLKKDLRLNASLLGVYWLLLITYIIIFYSGNENTLPNILLISQLYLFAFMSTVVVFAVDNSRDPNAFWRTQPLSASYLCVAKLLLVSLLIILPTTVVHWLFVESVIQGLPKYRVFEPLNYFLIQILCGALIGTSVSQSKPLILTVGLVIWGTMQFLVGWLEIHFVLQSPIFEGNPAIFISVGITLLLLMSLWFAYFRRNLGYHIPVVAVALVCGWLALQVVGPWFPGPTQLTSKPLHATPLNASDVRLKLYEWQNYEPIYYRLYAAIQAPKSRMQDYVLTTRSHISNRAGMSQYDASRGGFDQGEFTFVHTQLGFAAQKDRRLQPAIIGVAKIEPVKWQQTAHSPSTVEIEIGYSEPIVSIIADKPAISNSEINYQNQRFLLSSRMLSNARVAVSLSGYALEDSSFGVIIYNPDLKELVHTQRNTEKARPWKLALLNQPKIYSFKHQWSPAFTTERDPISSKNSLGYRALLSHPDKEWLAAARVMLYAVNQTKPIVETITLDNVDLENLALDAKFPM